MLVYLNQALEKVKSDVAIEGRLMTNDDVRQAILNGAVLRVRPIMMTVLAIVIGLIPIMMGSGAGSEVMQRIAGPMIGGMVSTVILTLLVIPAIYFVWKRAGIKNNQDTVNGE
jgi:copper/silver efflux system protein